MIELRVKGGVDAEAALTQIKLTAMRFPGDHELVIVSTYLKDDPYSLGPDRELSEAFAERRLSLGMFWRYDGSEACLAALREFGDVSIPVC